MNLWVKGALAAVGLMVVGGGAAWFFFGKGAQGPANPWYQGAEGYHQAQQQAVAALADRAPWSCRPPAGSH